MNRSLFYVYIMASASGTLYIGMTHNLQRRVYEHKHGLIEGFSRKYMCHTLVYFEEYKEYKEVHDAIAREKQLKNWRRAKKEFLIRKMNPAWEDLSAKW